jgi:orotidine-5'-phosphate decarboxylase
VLGIEPDPERLWPRALELTAGGRAGGGGEPPTMRAARAVAAHCRLLVEAAGAACVAVKPQVACFERLGAPGWAALAEVVADAHARGLLVIADAKRGDIDISARAYGEAFFGGVAGGPFGALPGLGADLLTASPLLGGDSLLALLGPARAAGGGLFVLVRTSNPGARDLQDRSLGAPPPDATPSARGPAATLSDALADLVDELGRPAVGAAGLSDVGAVVGATAPEHLARLRERMRAAIMLLPGVGAQGGTGADLEPAFAPGPAGGLVSASRAIAYASEAPGARGGDPAAAARGEAERLRELVWTRYA